jgi:hypothetical protein
LIEAESASVSRATTGKTTNKTAEFDKYSFYRRAVQAPDSDVIFLRDTYKELRGKAPVRLREDFCGTFSICCEWAKLNNRHQAYGVDLDPEPIQYGRENYLPKLSPAQRSRIEISQENVLSPGLPKADIIAAMNFSHFIFKERRMMKAYFKNCHATLNSNGILVTDIFGGSQCQEANEEATDRGSFIYYWDQTCFDPVSNHALFHIHFKPKGQKKIKNVFTYDWRMWTIPELREIMHEAGFRRTHVYWEGTTSSGEGDGCFTRTEKGEECMAWIAYVVGEK